MSDFESLEVPEHGPTFWEDLEESLAGSTRGVRPGWVWAPVAAVVVLIIGIGTAAVLDGDDRISPVATPDTGSFPATSTGPDSTPRVVPTTTIKPSATTDSQPVIDFLEDGVPAPWNQPPLRSDQVPAVLAEEWRKAANREWCSGLFSEFLFDWSGIRAANFSDGWAVAYDSSDQRSLFGIAGAAVMAPADVGIRWPNRIRFDDGTVFGWGGEGFDESNPRRLGELSLPGEGCLYQIWSEAGDDPLVEIAKSLRRVESLEE